MIIMVYSAFNAASIEAALGAPEYSYWFVRRAFWPVLEQIGIVVPVTDPKREVDTIARAAAERGQDSVFLSFEPPHKTVLGLNCRTVPVFAWEFDTIPDETWEDEPRQDWAHVLSATGSAITHSQFSAAAVRAKLGTGYPVWSIPAPVWDRHAPRAAEARGWHEEEVIALDGIVLDAAEIDLDVFSINRAHDDGIESLRALVRWMDEAERPSRGMRIGGVVYTAVFNPLDGRKNFTDLLGAFIWAFRDTPDAVLLLKLTHFDPVRGLMPVLSDLAKFGRFRCRILIVQGMLPDAQYQDLLRLSSYTVNASTNEGQCLPLMEFMSAGRPAIAPRHTALLDYVSDANSFVVDSFTRPAAWPHDPREAIRTERHVVSVASLIRQYRESYRVARQDPARYRAMSQAACDALRDFCSDEVVMARLRQAVAPGSADMHGPARSDAA